MVLTIILAILTLSIISGLVLMYVWWKKYGKQLFKMIYGDNIDIKSIGGTKDIFNELNKTMNTIKGLNNINKNGKRF
jgi:hypothetical protein